jgi:hypothetical protein
MVRGKCVDGFYALPFDFAGFLGVATRGLLINQKAAREKSQKPNRIKRQRFKLSMRVFLGIRRTTRTHADFAAFLAAAGGASRGLQ